MLSCAGDHRLQVAKGMCRKGSCTQLGFPGAPKVLIPRVGSVLGSGSAVAVSGSCGCSRCVERLGCWGMWAPRLGLGVLESEGPDP